MIVYRVAKTVYAGTLRPSRRAARWNSDNRDMIYTAQSLALASLEILVHSNGLLLRAGNFSRAIIEIPDKVSLEIFDIKLLPADYNGQTPYHITQTLGDEWLAKGKHAVLCVPSSIIPGEFNYLLNSNHSDFPEISIISVEPFVFDGRLK